jgi:hypothetical protein
MSKDNVAQLRTKTNDDGGLGHFLALIERGKSEIFSETVIFTKPIVDWLIERNYDNRSLKKRIISGLVADIRNGFWQVNGETIVVSKSGELNDGQHRLAAFAEANIPVKSLVAFGVPRDSRFTVDMGTARCPADFLHMNGVSNTTMAAAIVNLHLLYLKGIYGRSASVGKNVINTKPDLLEQYEKNKDMYDTAVDIVSHNRFCRVLGNSAVGAAYCILYSISPSKADGFFERLIDGDGLTKGDPILALRNKLSTSGERLFSNERLEMILRTWNAWRSGKQVTRCPSVSREYPKVSR